MDKILVGKGGPTKAGWHSLGMLLRCAKAYQFERVRGIARPATQTASPFAIGAAFGSMRAQWYGANFDMSPATWKKMRRAAKEEAEENKLPVSKADLQYAEALAQRYMEHWSRRPKPQPIAAEYELGPTPLREGDPPAMHRTGRLDDLSRYPEAGGALCIGECKTTSGDIGTSIREYELHGQPMLYYALYKLDPNGEARFGPVEGVVLDVVKKPDYNQMGKASFVRAFIEIRPATLDWFIDSLRGHLAAAARIDWNTEVPRNVSGCTYMAGRMRVDCPFKELCRFGKSAAGQYVLPGGKGLKTFKPDKERWRLPWE